MKFPGALQVVSGTAPVFSHRLRGGSCSTINSKAVD